MRFLLTALIVVSLSACESDSDTSADSSQADTSDSAVNDTSSDSTNGDLQWYTTCGDPVCGGSTVPMGAEICDTQEQDAACSTAEDFCWLDDDCGGKLLCTDSDPKEPGCPISQREKKSQIHYITELERSDYAASLLQTKLATYAYKKDPKATKRLGFIIDDVGQSFAVLPDGKRVDIYGFTSLAVATIQAQQAQIEALSARIEKLEAAQETKSKP